MNTTAGDAGTVGPSPDAALQALLAESAVIDPRTRPVRFSRLKAFASSAAHYHAAVQDDRVESLSMRIGSGTHAGLFLNRPVVCFPGRRQGKVWARFEQQQRESGAIVVNQAEHKKTIGMVTAVRRHRKAPELLFDDAITERTIDWALGDRACRSTPDSFSRSGRRQTELKTTRCAEPRWLAREALRRHYNAQLSFYDTPIEQLTGHCPDEEYIVAVENVPPYCVTVLRLTDEAREQGAKLCHLWFAALLAAEHANYYGGYVEDVVDLELPALDAREPITVEIDGELVTVD